MPSNLTSISFPASPSVGSTYTYGNQTYQWNGTEWVVSYDSNSIPVGAVTLSGNQTITGTKSFSSLNLTSLLNNADFTITNQNGYLQLGPLNTNYCHLNTDRPVFYLNRKIENGEGIFASYFNTDLKLATYATTRLTILNSNGNVGIATENPQTRLDIVVPSTGTTLTGVNRYAGIHLDQTNTNDEFVGITTSATTSGTQGGILFQGSGAYGTKIHFLTTDQYAAGMQNRMTIDSYGNVGIGNTNPGLKLSVGTTGTGSDGINIINLNNGAYGSLHAQGSVGGVASWANGFVVEGVPASTGNTILSSYTGNLSLHTARTERLRIESGGDVSITSTTASSSTTTGALKVAGGVGIVGSLYANSTAVGGAASGTPIIIGTASSIGIYVTSAVPTFSAAKGSLCINTGATAANTRLYINNNGTTGWSAVTSA